MWSCLGSGHKLLSSPTVFAMCHDSNVFLFRLFALSMILELLKSIIWLKVHACFGLNVAKHAWTFNLNIDFNNCKIIDKANNWNRKTLEGLASKRCEHKAVIWDGMLPRLLELIQDLVVLFYIQKKPFEAPNEIIIHGNLHTDSKAEISAIQLHEIKFKWDLCAVENLT